VSRHTGDTGQIDQGQIRTSVREHLQDDGLVDNVGVVAANFVSQRDNLLLDFFHVGELLSWNFFGEHSIGLGAFVSVIKTHFKGTTRAQAGSTGQEIQSDDGFEDG